MVRERFVGDGWDATTGFKKGGFDDNAVADHYTQAMVIVLISAFIEKRKLWTFGWSMVFSGIVWI
jgi:hypothetical protein